MKEWEIELRQLLSSESEDELLEFKEAKDAFDIDELGSYFSALSNEANLHGVSHAWIIFGVEDKRHKIVGTQYRNRGSKLQKTKEHIKQGTNDITFIEIRELTVDNKRVVMFKVPAAPQGIPTSYKKHYYERVHESLQGLSIEKLERIRAQNRLVDWSDALTAGGISDVVPEALARARIQYKEKNSRLGGESDGWSDAQFLRKVRLMRGRNLTNAGIILLGTPESTDFLTDGAIAKVSWILRSANGEMRDYAHFTAPFIMTVDDIYRKIRNLKYRYMSGETLFPDEVDQYDTLVIREALHNCIAHQDYTLGGKINLVEVEDDSLVFSNMGAFLPRSVEEVVMNDTPQEVYRNTRLAEAMGELNMIDTVGSGIRKMFESQRRKFFPLPDYDLSNNKVQVKIMGRVLDIEYARKLAGMPSINLPTIMLLDKVNKSKYISKDEAAVLRRQGLIEGRYPNVRVSLSVAKETEGATEYMRRRAVDDGYALEMIVQYLNVNGVVTRAELARVIGDKLSSALTDEQKSKKISYLLQKLKAEGAIIPTKDKSWVLHNKTN